MRVGDLGELPWPLETQRLRLRPLTLDDVDAVWAFRRLPEVVRYLSHDVLTRDEVAERVAERIGRSSLDAQRPVLALAVEDAVTGAVVGDCVVSLARCRSSARGEVHEWQGTIGYALHPSVHGRGLATEVTRALLRLGFETLGLHRMTAEAFAPNVASNRVLAKAGMRLEATHVRAALGKDGTWLDDNVYALLADEWTG